MRPYKPYSPPTDVEAKLKEIIQKYVSQGSSLSNGRTKFKVLSACFKEFNHSVPNSRLHEVNNTGELLYLFPGHRMLQLVSFIFIIPDDLVEFYKTPVDVRIPLEKFKSIELPQNLHIQYEYHRFHPETDTRFNGVSAFPQSSTIVTGLKYKKKYAGYTAKPRWS